MASLAVMWTAAERRMNGRPCRLDGAAPGGFAPAGWGLASRWPSWQVTISVADLSRTQAKPAYVVATNTIGIPKQAAAAMHAQSKRSPDPRSAAPAGPARWAQVIREAEEGEEDEVEEDEIDKLQGAAMALAQLPPVSDAGARWRVLRSSNTLMVDHISESATGQTDNLQGDC